MEYVDGRDVRRLIQRAVMSGERVPLPVAIAIAMGAAAGLHPAHENTAADRTPLHNVHRDVSPANVILTFDGHIKLIDFGIAKAARRQTETQAGTVKGKYSYMSPEQCNGGELDRRSDIFSLGITLWELTTSTRLFRSKNDYEVMRKIVRDPIPSPRERIPDYPAELETVVMRALERDVDLRYQTARALYEDLEAVAAHHGMQASPFALSDYIRRMFPDEAEQSVFELDLQTSDASEDPSDEGDVHRLSSPVVANLALRAPTVTRAATDADTVIVMPPTRILEPKLDERITVRPPPYRWVLPAACVVTLIWLVWLLARL
jgi:serine/threonine protein kinase